jgi:T4 RnlA family RNA ligase
MLRVEDINRIVELNPNFYKQEYTLFGNKISLYNYTFGDIKDFKQPIPGEDIQAWELRGLLVVNDKDVYPLMDKFFNVNQYEEWSFENLSKLEIESVFLKEDGSIISFVDISGNIVARSKMSFNSYQSDLANKIYQEDVELQEFVKFCISNDLVPIFELVGPSNPIVVEYQKNELILLRLRSRKTGQYLPVKELGNRWGIKTPPLLNYTLSELMEMVDTVEGIEGWIVNFKNGISAKIKTKWYLDRHKLFTSELNRENDIIRLILEDKIDDIISQLKLEDNKRNFISNITDKINFWIEKSYNEIIDLSKDWNGDRREFSIKNRNHPLFGISISYLSGSGEQNLRDMLKSKLKKDTLRLERAKSFLNS